MDTVEMTQQTPIKRKYDAMMADVKRVHGEKADVTLEWDDDQHQEIIIKLDSGEKKLEKNNSKMSEIDWTK